MPLNFVLRTSSCAREASSPGRAVAEGKLGGRSSSTLPGCRVAPEASVGAAVSKVGCRLGAPSPMMGAKPMGMGPGAGAGTGAQLVATGQEQLHCVAKRECLTLR